MKLLEPESHLPMLLRCIHCIPVIAGAADSAEEYPYTSHRMYARELYGWKVCTTSLQSPTHVRRLH